MLVATKLFNIAVNDYDAKKSTCCGQVFVVTELVESGTQCTYCYFGTLFFGPLPSLQDCEKPSYLSYNKDIVDVFSSI